jgi:hypothetical protein
MKRLTIALILLIAGGIVHADDSSAFFDRLDRFPSDEQFRQLSLMLMISDGADDALIQALESRPQTITSAAAEESDAVFNFDDYTTPLIRIVDQETMLAGATRLFRFTRNNKAAIAARLRTFENIGTKPVDGSTAPAISEDAIIIRNAIADSIDYSELQANSTSQSGGLSESYRVRTIYLRNNLEYTLFAAELDRITRESVDSVGGKTDAYERMFDDEVDSAAINKKIDAAEFAYGWDRDFDKRAAKLAEEILNNIWNQESDMKP